MISQSKLSILVASGIIGGGICAVGFIYFYKANIRDNAGSTTSSSRFMTSSPNPSIQIQTPEYLMAHPAALKAAELQCQVDTTPDIVAICDNVHEAEAGLLASEYKNASTGKSQ